MKICVISGSPKGEYSITLQTALYLEKRFPGHEWEYLHAGRRIKSLEKDFSPALEAMERAELLLFCYPVYTFLAPSQLHRFIERMKESGADISGKFAAQITTSKHFYDVTAHRYVEENCADMGLRYLGGLSADMDDLLKEKGRSEAERFFRYALWRAENGIWEQPKPARTDSSGSKAYTLSHADSEKRPGNEAVIVADIGEGGSLPAMIEDFRRAYPHNTKVVNIAQYPFDGGCLGCFHCASTGKCVYRDGFDAFLRDEIQSAKAIVYAFSIKDHSMGARFKLYDDRQFCNGHRTVTMGMPVGYLVEGDYEREANLRMVIEGRADVGGNFLCGVAVDAPGVERLAETLRYALDEKLALPQTFLGVGGMKIFRDLIWQMRGMMKADHRFYKAHGFYDFPQKQRGTALKMQLVGLLLSNPAIVKKMGNKMNEGMIAPYRKVLEKISQSAE